METKDYHDIIINLIGGVLVTLLDRLYLFLRRKLSSFRFRKIFGQDLDDFNLVYGKMVLKESVKENYPYTKPKTGGEFRVSSPVSFTETTSAKYLAEAFSKNKQKSPRLISDDELLQKVDISFCSLGGFNNYKTIEIINSEENTFYNIEYDKIVTKLDQTKSFKIDENFDYGLIIKIENRLFPKRTQICVAGIGELGTSGASWFLANKWNEILKRAGNRSFGCIIKVRRVSDESAEIVDFILKS